MHTKKKFQYLLCSNLSLCAWSVVYSFTQLIFLDTKRNGSLCALAAIGSRTSKKEQIKEEEERKKKKSFRKIIEIYLKIAKAIKAYKRLAHRPNTLLLLFYQFFFVVFCCLYRVAFNSQIIVKKRNNNEKIVLLSRSSKLATECARTKAGIHVMFVCSLWMRMIGEFLFSSFICKWSPSFTRCLSYSISIFWNFWKRQFGDYYFSFI